MYVLIPSKCTKPSCHGKCGPLSILIKQLQLVDVHFISSPSSCLSSPTVAVCSSIQSSESLPMVCRSTTLTSKGIRGYSGDTMSDHAQKHRCRLPQIAQRKPFPKTLFKHTGGDVRDMVAGKWEPLVRAQMLPGGALSSWMGGSCLSVSIFHLELVF